MTKNSDIYGDPIKDSYVESVKEKFTKRSKKGIKKYKNSLEREDIDFPGWLNHLQEELMDATLYIERLKDSYAKEKITKKRKRNLGE